ncbi:MAG: hypothetical protein JWP75_982, partial [Frondihabitans sp.]|nr:hypothetical protein [Frondihabitans sp.]
MRQLISVQAFRIGLVGALGVGLGIAIITGIGTISVVLTYVGVAYFLSLALEPIIVWLERSGIRRGAAVGLIFAVLVVLITAVIFTVAPLVGRQLLAVAHRAPLIVDHLTKAPWFTDLTGQLGVDSSVNGLLSSVTDFLKNPAHLNSIGSGLLSFGTGVVDGIVATFIVLILTIYFTATLPVMTNKAFQMVPASKAAAWRSIYEEMTLSVGRYVIGQVTLAALNAALTFILLLVFHVPGIALLTALAFVGALIPIIDTVVEAVVIIVVCLFTSPAAAIAAIIFYLVYHPVEAYVLTPRVMSRAVH